jgi:hypothetical protein
MAEEKKNTDETYEAEKENKKSWQTPQLKKTAQETGERDGG